MYYLRGRYYDPTIGRFLTRDPLPASTREPQSLNAYPYVQNNPVNRVDPTGLFSQQAVLGDALLRSIACALSFDTIAGGLIIAAEGELPLGLFLVALGLFSYYEACPDVINPARG